MEIDIKKCFIRSEDVIVKEIEDQTVILPVIDGVGDLDAPIYTLNETGTLVWKRLSPTMTLKKIISTISQDFDVSAEEIQTDTISLVRELLEKNLIAEYKGTQ